MHTGAQSSESKSQTNLIVNYLPQSMAEDDVRKLFAAVGEVQSCKVIKDKQSQVSLGYAFINYISAGDAEKAIQSLNGLPLQNKTIKVSYARPSSSTIMDANLYIAYLPKMFTQGDLDTLFRPYGNIITSKILHDAATGLSRGVGFIRFDKHHEADKAILALNGKQLPGAPQPILVKFANPAKTTTTLNTRPMSMGLAINNMANLSRRVNSMFNSSGAGGPMRHSIASNLRYNPVSVNSGLAANQSHAGGQGFCLFVFNIPESSQANLLYELFCPFGAITSVKVMRDPEGKCKGFGFVNMVNYEEAYNAICALNGYLLDGKSLQVSFKKQS